MKDPRCWFCGRPLATTRICPIFVVVAIFCAFMTIRMLVLL